MKTFLLIFLAFFTTSVLAFETFWEHNVTVRKVESMPANTYLSTPSKIDLNTANKKELQKLKGIGPKKAEMIVEYRSNHGSFKKIEDLAKIKGFSKKLVKSILEKNKDILVVSPYQINNI